MKICIIGAGYVGLVVGACLADMGNDVICTDNNEQKLELLNQGIIQMYERGLEDLIKANVAKKRLIFSSDVKKAVEESPVCFITVGTPQKDDGGAELKYVKEAAKIIGQSMKQYTVVVNKSTVPVGTAGLVSDIIKMQTNVDFDVVSNPEFLRQGNSVNDFLNPERIIIGSDSQRAVEIMRELYNPLLKAGCPVILMDVKSAEMTKYAANAFLALKISYANEIANICEKTGANADMVRTGMCSDKRIGSQYLHSGLGYGGSCLPKDVNALIKIAAENNCDYGLLKAVDEINKKQRKSFTEKILEFYGNDITDKTVAIWGLAFKPETNDMREAPAIDIVNQLLEKGARIQAYDPKAFEQAKSYFGDKIVYSNSAYEALEKADCLVLVTEWQEFKQPDFAKIKLLLKEPTIFDGRNQYNGDKLIQAGFNYICIGKNLTK